MVRLAAFSLAALAALLGVSACSSAELKVPPPRPVEARPGAEDPVGTAPPDASAPDVSTPTPDAGANTKCNQTVTGTHACTISELYAAEAAGDLVGLKDIGNNLVGSFWAIDPAAPGLQQCVDDAGRRRRAQVGDQLARRVLQPQHHQQQDDADLGAGFDELPAGRQRHQPGLVAAIAFGSGRARSCRPFRAAVGAGRGPVLFRP